MAPLDPRRCVVLMPYGSPIVPECEAGLRALERLDDPVRRVGGSSAVDRARILTATAALVDGFEETMWIDADVGSRAEDVATLRRLDRPIACGVYPRQGSPEPACHVLPGTPRLVFGAGGGQAEILHAGSVRARRQPPPRPGRRRGRAGAVRLIPLELEAHDGPSPPNPIARCGLRAGCPSRPWRGWLV